MNLGCLQLLQLSAERKLRAALSGEAIQCIVLATPTAMHSFGLARTLKRLEVVLGGKFGTLQTTKSCACPTMLADSIIEKLWNRIVF